MTTGFRAKFTLMFILFTVALQFSAFGNQAIDRNLLVLPGPVFVAVHHAAYREALDAKPGLNSALHRWRRSGRTSVFLVEYKDDIKNWYGDFKNPDVLFVSQGGENNIAVNGGDIVITGGFFGDCFSHAIQSLIHNHFLVNKSPLTFHIPMRAVFLFPNVSLSRQISDTNLEAAYRTFGYEPIVKNMIKGAAPDLLKNFSNLDPAKYELKYYFNGELKSDSGNGPIVQFEFWSDDNFIVATTP